MFSMLLTLILSASNASAVASDTSLNRPKIPLSIQAGKAIRTFEQRTGAALSVEEKEALAKLEMRANSKLQVAQSTPDFNNVTTRLYCLNVEAQAGDGAQLNFCSGNGRSYDVWGQGGVGLYLTVGVSIIDIQHRPNESLDGFYSDAAGVSVGVGVSITEISLKKLYPSPGSTVRVFGIGIGAGATVNNFLTLGILETESSRESSIRLQ